MFIQKIVRLGWHRCRFVSIFSNYICNSLCAHATSVFLLSFSIYLLEFYLKHHSLIGYATHYRFCDKDILLDVLLCGIAEYFYELCCILTTSKNYQRYYTTKNLIRDLLSNTPNCFFATSIRQFVPCVLRDTGPLEYKYCMVFVLVLGVINCILRSAVG